MRTVGFMQYFNNNFITIDKKNTINVFISGEINDNMSSLQQNCIKWLFKQRISQPGDISQSSKAYQKNHLA